ncbi:zinc finger protein 43 isoform X2 [Athalia rosae]|uniref:zinc finger protein 43 isoform X2 n=1 Tax=Athalia rosae TaxID=37344 RepID=UPI0020346106|nr:zinc finger protein 43 isoform X2 [Athalia rosae]XP_012265102.2 zinc finger protein 43 isoform X2 [Athalia rosae]
MSEEETVSIPDISGSKNTHKCTYFGCNAVFSRPSRLVRHVRQHTGERPYKCSHDGCDKAYTNTSHLKRHSQTHNLTKQSFKCTKCSLTISNLHNLKRHYERVHAENQSLSCESCGVKFTKEQKYKEHKAMHDGIALYKCKKCAKQFTLAGTLRKHERSHDKKKKYSCTAPFCSEIFDKWSLLCKHKQTMHSIEYKCKDCEKSFLTKTHLKVHSIVHSDNRDVLPCPFDKCARFYFFKRNLDHHVRTIHLGIKYRCDICNLEVSTKQKIIGHITKIHLSTNKKTVNRSKKRRRRDAGITRKSMLAKLSGIDLPWDIEKELLNRIPKVPEGLKETNDLVQTSVIGTENSQGIGKTDQLLLNDCTEIICEFSEGRGERQVANELCNTVDKELQLLNSTVVTKISVR